MPAGRLSRRQFAGMLAAGLVRDRASAADPAASQSRRPVTIASEEDVTTLDPHLIRNNHPIGSIIWSVFDSLVRRRPDGAHEPRLALSWQNPTPTTWLFQLRPGVVFHNGEAFDAGAVVDNLGRMRRSPLNAESQLWQQTGLVAVSAVGAMAVQLQTAAPSTTLLYWLEEAFIAAPGWLRDSSLETIGAAPVGSGPYRFVEWQRGDHVTLVANERYWAGPPAIRDVVFRSVPELSARVDELRAGSVDLVPGLDPDVAAAITSPRCRVDRLRGLRKMHLGLSQTGIAPLRDRRVRRALNHAVDVETMIATLQDGATTRLVSVINPPNADPGLPAYGFDPARALALLREAGQTGFAVELAYDGKYPDAQETAEAAASYLSAVGLRPQVTAYESGHFLQTLRSRGFPGLYFYGFSALIEPLIELVIFTRGAVDNACGYENPTVDTLVAAAAATPDAARRAPMIAEAERIVWDDAPWIFLWYLPAIYGISTRLEYAPRPDDYIEISHARLTS